MLRIALGVFGGFVGWMILFIGVPFPQDSYRPALAIPMSVNVSYNSLTLDFTTIQIAAVIAGERPKPFGCT